MLDIDKQYVYNEQGEAIAVQISLEQFQQIEQLLNPSEPQTQEELDSEQSEAELGYVNGILVIKSQGTRIPASIVDDMREERIREIGGW